VGFEIFVPVSRKQAKATKEALRRQFPIFGDVAQHYDLELFTYGGRVFNASGDTAQGDDTLTQVVYNDTTGNLTQGMPLCKDATDAGQFNSGIGSQPATALTTAPIPPPTGGFVVQPNNANTNQYAFHSLYVPKSPGDKPAKGDAVRGIIYGLAIASVISPAAGTAIKVGYFGVVGTTQTSLISAAAPVVGTTVGMVLATAGFGANGAQIAAAGSATATLVNMFVRPL
jgi:hypothetical protein